LWHNTAARGKLQVVLIERMKCLLTSTGNPLMGFLRIAFAPILKFGVNIPVLSAEF
jgi:hypothetical protein